MTCMGAGEPVRSTLQVGKACWQKSAKPVVEHQIEARMCTHAAVFSLCMLMVAWIPFQAMLEAMMLQLIRLASHVGGASDMKVLWRLSKAARLCTLEISEGINVVTFLLPPPKGPPASGQTSITQRWVLQVMLVCMLGVSRDLAGVDAGAQGRTGLHDPALHVTWHAGLDIKMLNHG